MKIFLLLAQIVCALTATAAAVITLSVPWWPNGMIGVMPALLGLLGGAFAPRLGLAAGLVCLPLGGNRPGTPHFIGSVVFGSAFLCGITVRRLVCREEPLLNRTTLSHPLLFAAAAYGLISLASLAAIPPGHIVDDVRNIAKLASLADAAVSVELLLSVNEHAPLFSCLSVYLTLLSITLGFAAAALCRRDGERTARLFIGAVGTGLLGSCLAGLLDYYGLLNLAALRPLDPIVNPGERQFRLQSFFAHSGWYAEYVTLTVPTCLLLLALRLPFPVRVGLMLLAALVGEFVLILTYQRGGWLSYPLTLIAVWAAIYVVQRLERGESDVITALKRSALKVALSLPLTIAVSLSLLAAIGRTPSGESALSPYFKRFSDIQRTGDRTEFLHAGVLIGLRHPILGAGADSFAAEFDREVVAPTGALAGRFHLPLHGSAHNVYAQTFAGKGILGLGALLAIPLLLIGLAGGAIKDPTRPIGTKLIVLTGACFGCAFLIYGNVQEVFYIQALQFLFFIISGTIAAVTPQSGVSERLIQRSLLTLAAAFILHLIWEYGAPGTARLRAAAPREFGCFPEETAPNGERYRWCGEHAVMELFPASLTFEAGAVPQTVTVLDHEMGLNSVIISLHPGERQTVSLPASSSPAPHRFVRLHAGASFMPREIDRTSADARRLAFKVIFPENPVTPERPPRGPTLGK